MGVHPNVRPLADESEPGKTHDNPEPADADRFIRAASGVRFLDFDGPTKVAEERPARLAIAQDSRRKLAVADLGMSFEALLDKPSRLVRAEPFSISMIPVDTAANISTYEDDARDYASYRKKTKKDYEAMTTLPSGEVLVLGSGSDMRTVTATRPSFRSTAILLDPATGAPRNMDVHAFYTQLDANRDVIGPDSPAGPPELNIEAVAVRPGANGRTTLAFFHRGNVNGNGYNSVVEFEYATWRTALDATAAGADPASTWASVVPTRIVRLVTPMVVSAGDPSQTAFPITINDALFGSLDHEPTFFVPAGAEAEFIDAQGQHQDGLVTFAGVLRWRNIDAANGGSCEVFQMQGDDAPGEVTRFGKVEGLAAWNPSGDTPFERSLYGKKALVVGVTDVDSEIKPSTLSVLDLSDLD